MIASTHLGFMLCSPSRLKGSKKPCSATRTAVITEIRGVYLREKVSSVGVFRRHGVRREPGTGIRPAEPLLLQRCSGSDRGRETFLTKTGVFGGGRPNKSPEGIFNPHGALLKHGPPSETRPGDSLRPLMSGLM